MLYCIVDEPEYVCMYVLGLFIYPCIQMLSSRELIKGSCTLESSMNILLTFKDSYSSLIPGEL